MNIEHALVEEPSAHQHRKYKPKTTHDVCLYLPSTRITEGAVTSYLRDIGVNDIIRISKISLNGHESEFRIIIGDEIVTHTVYGHRKFRKDSIIMQFKRYRSNSTPIRHHGRSNQGENRNQTREMRDRQRDQPAVDTLLPRPANTNMDPVIPCSATTSNVDLYPSIKGQGHQELFQDPANHQPSLAILSQLSQHQQVPNTSQTIHTLPTANYPSVRAFTTSDPPYKNTTRYNPVCAPTQRNDNVHYQSPNNPAAPLTWSLSPSTYYQQLANQLSCHQTF